MPDTRVVSKTTQILSPSLILPSTVLFMLQVLTSDKPHFKKLYKITVQQSKYLMQKSALFDKLSTQFAQLSSNTSLNSDTIEEANGLPILCIEAPVHGGLEIVDASLDWLYASADIKDVLTSSLASKIRTYQDFFSLLNFTTLLDLYEPFRGAVDQILVYYYFGLSVEERRVGILSNKMFVEGIIPGNFVKRLAESVNEDTAKEILISFFRGKQLKSLNGMNEDEEWEELSLDDDMGNESPTKRANTLDWINSTITPTPLHVSFSVPNTPLTASLDHAEPPTPLGSAYFRSLPNIPLDSIPSSLLHTPKSVKFKQIPYIPTSDSACIVQNVPPNTPSFLMTPSIVSTRNGLLSPPTRNKPTIQENHDTIMSPTLASSPKVKTPTTPTIVIMDSDLQIENFEKKEYSFIRRELFENALNKMRRRPLYFK
ncbi:12019_t:CDS:2 [Cetraspora pellucida]|uniref:12019_t:CDS:1 n=1 Tax=Cetraspora pellucida TaxID=1433469 RepID=A0A9N9GKH0_9GLOM|nr:12019_t:CDS:2 [Cetraspora pellucida]